MKFVMRILLRTRVTQLITWGEVTKKHQFLCWLSLHKSQQDLIDRYCWWLAKSCIITNSTTNYTKLTQAEREKSRANTGTTEQVTPQNRTELAKSQQDSNIVKRTGKVIKVEKRPSRGS